MTRELATSALFLISALYGSPSASAIPSPQSPSVSTPVAATASPTVIQPLTLEAYVREYYRDTPILSEIAACESRFRHLDTDGKPLRGELSYDDVGVMQINEFFHEDRAKRFGFDLHTLDGNLAYAKWLYGKEGVTPWSSSSKCWQKADTIAKANERTVTN